MDYQTWIAQHPEIADESTDYKKEQYQIYLESLTDLYVDHY